MIATLPEKARNTAGKIRDQARRTKTLVGNLLSFARQVPSERTLLDINTVVTNAVQLRGMDLRSSNARIELQLESVLPGVRGDGNQLMQVFFNIISNAIDAMESHDGGVLTVKTIRDRGNVVVLFSDTGPGLQRTASRVRSLLHHQAGWKRHRSGLEHLLRYRAGTCREDILLQQSGRRRRFSRGIARRACRPAEQRRHRCGRGRRFVKIVINPLLVGSYFRATLCVSRWRTLPCAKRSRAMLESCFPNLAREPHADIAIVTERLTRRFGGLTAVDGVDLRVTAGQFFGFLGPNGAGKSTTIKMLTGLLAPSSGRVTLLGVDFSAHPVEVKRQIGVVPEGMGLFERLTGAEYLQFVGRMYGLELATTKRRSEELLEFMQLADRPKTMVADYSHGMQKKLALAAAVIHGPRILFLDEPFEGVDALAAGALKALLGRMTERGVTIFLTSHVLEIVERLCSHVAIINKGRLVAQGSLEELRAGIPGEEGDAQDPRGDFSFHRRARRAATGRNLRSSRG